MRWKGNPLVIAGLATFCVMSSCETTNAKRYATEENKRFIRASFVYQEALMHFGLRYFDAMYEVIRKNDGWNLARWRSVFEEGRLLVPKLWADYRIAVEPVPVAWMEEHDKMTEINEIFGASFDEIARHWGDWSRFLIPFENLGRAWQMLIDLFNETKEHMNELEPPPDR